MISWSDPGAGESSVRWCGRAGLSQLTEAGGWWSAASDLWTSNLVSRRGCIFMLVAAGSQARRPTRVREKYCEASQSPVLAPAPASPPASAGTLLPSLSRTPSQPHGLTRLTRLPGCRHTNNLSLNLAPPTFPGLYNLPLLIPAKL